MPRYAALAAAALLCTAAACAGPRNGAAHAGQALEGRIVAVEPQAEVTRVRVRPEGGGEFVLLVRSGTRIVRRRADGASVPAAAGDLAPGTRIEAEHTGVELRSLAPQYEATRIRILPEP